MAFKTLRMKKEKFTRVKKVLMYCTLDARLFRKLKSRRMLERTVDVTDPSVYVKFKGGWGAIVLTDDDTVDAASEYGTCSKTLRLNT